MCCNLLLYICSFCWLLLTVIWMCFMCEFFGLIWVSRLQILLLSFGAFLSVAGVCSSHVQSLDYFSMTYLGKWDYCQNWNEHNRGLKEVGVNLKQYVQGPKITNIFLKHSYVIAQYIFGLFSCAFSFLWNQTFERNCEFLICCLFISMNAAKSYWKIKYLFLYIFVSTVKIRAVEGHDISHMVFYSLFLNRYLE